MTAAHERPAHGGGKRSNINVLGSTGLLIENQRVEPGRRVAPAPATRAAESSPLRGGFFPGRAPASGLPRKGGRPGSGAPPCAHRSIFSPDAIAANMVGQHLGPGGRGLRHRRSGPGARVGGGAGK